MFLKNEKIKRGMSKIRTGWKIRNIPEEIAETVLEHSEKVEKAASIYGKNFMDLDLKRLIKMARYHDIAEYKIKDYVPGEISDLKKHNIEKNVILELKDDFEEKGKELFDIWMEYEKGESKESKIVKQLDKLDAAIQSMEYEKLGYHKITSFYDYTLGKLTDPILINILKILMKKEYLGINTYDQYFLLLEYNGNEIVFKEKMAEIIKQKG